MKAKTLLLPVATMIFVTMLLSAGALALSTTVTQSGADSDEVMKGRTFTVEATGWTGDCNQAQISFGGCSSCSLSGEQSTKTIGGGATSVTWTTTSATQSATAQTVTISMLGVCGGQTADSSSFDIVLPPSLSVTAIGDSTVSKGSSFTSNINILNSGETTANDITVAVSGTGMSGTCSPIPTINEGQSAAEPCTTTASSVGSRTVIFTVSSTNADSASGSHTITVNPVCGDGVCDTGETTTSCPADCTGGGGDTPGGPGGAPSGDQGQNKSNRPTLVPGVGLRNNTRLQAAIERVLGQANMSDQARENMLRLSASITSDISTTRMFNVSGGKSRITTRMRYSGQEKARNFMLFESVPKGFATNASLVTVSAPGATVEIAEEDPSWVIMYPELNPDDEIIISYEIDGTKDSDLIDDVQSEVYAEALEDVDSDEGDGAEACDNDGVCEAGETTSNCPADCPATTPGDGGTTPGDGAQPGAAADSTLLIIIVVIVIIVIVVVIAAVLYNRKGSSSIM